LRRRTQLGSTTGEVGNRVIPTDKIPFSTGAPMDGFPAGDSGQEQRAEEAGEENRKRKPSFSR